MPVKKRTAKHRADPATRYLIWSSVLDSGADFFRELPTIGIDRDGEEFEQEAYVAWCEFGQRVLAERDPRDLRVAWAETQFGRPWEARHAD